MNVRVVRFTDVTDAQMNTMLTRINAGEGPPDGTNFAGLEVLYDADAHTAVVVQRFDSADDLETAARVLAAMDPGETPGTRASVDVCAQMLELTR